MDGLVEGLAFDVPERDIDGADGGGGDAPPGEEVAAEHQLPEELDIRRILSQQVRSHVLDGANSCLLLPGDAELTHPVEAFVGLNLHKQEISPSRTEGKRPDIGDLHDVFSFGYDRSRNSPSTTATSPRAMPKSRRGLRRGESGANPDHNRRMVSTRKTSSTKTGTRYATP